MLVQYVYEYYPVSGDVVVNDTIDNVIVTEVYLQRRPFACVVAIAPDKIGVSVVNPTGETFTITDANGVERKRVKFDHFNKKRARAIALGRAECYDETFIPSISGKVNGRVFDGQKSEFAVVSRQSLIEDAVAYVRERAKTFNFGEVVNV